MGPLALALAKTDVWEGHAGQTQATSSRMQNPYRILLLVCHRVIWDPGYLVERIAICAHAESRLFEITIPHAARESAHVVVSPEHPQQSIRLSMSDKVPGDVGKYLKLSNGSDVVGTKKGEFFMCTEHSVHRTGDTTKDRLDAVVFKDKSVLDKAIAALKVADPATYTFGDVMTTHGRLKFGGFTMAKLARVCGSDAKAKNLFIAGAARVDPALVGRVRRRGADRAAGRHHLPGHSASH